MKNIKCYYHAVLFDFDGTLVDTMHKYADIASKEINKIYGISRENAKQLYFETSGEPFFKQLEIIFGESSKNEECAAAYEHTKAQYLKSVKLDNANRQLLRNIKKLGISTAVTSNNFQNLIDDFLRKEEGLFDIVLGYGNELSKGPTQFAYVIDKFGIDRRYALFVGDSLSDARKALAFGIDFVAISGTLRKDSFTSIFPAIPVISSFAELKPLLEQQKPLNCMENKL